VPTNSGGDKDGPACPKGKFHAQRIFRLISFPFSGSRRAAPAIRTNSAREWSAAFSPDGLTWPRQQRQHRPDLGPDRPARPTSAVHHHRPRRSRCPPAHSASTGATPARWPPSRTSVTPSNRSRSVPTAAPWPRRRLPQLPTMGHQQSGKPRPPAFITPEKRRRPRDRICCNSKTLATGSVDGTVRLWNVNDRQHPQQTGIFTGHTKMVTAVAVTPDGHTSQPAAMTTAPASGKPTLPASSTASTASHTRESPRPNGTNNSPTCSTNHPVRKESLCTSGVVLKFRCPGSIPPIVDPRWPHATTPVIPGSLPMPSGRFSGQADGQRGGHGPCITEWMREARSGRLPLTRGADRIGSPTLSGSSPCRVGGQPGGGEGAGRATGQSRRIVAGNARPSSSKLTAEQLVA